MLTAIRLVVTALACWYIVRSVDWHSTAGLFSDVKLLYLVPPLLLYFAIVLIRAWRWQMLFSHHKRLPYLVFARLVLISMFSSNLLPTSFGEDVIRIYGLSRYASKVANVVSATMVERFTGFVGISIVACISLIFWQPFMELVIIAFMGLLLLIGGLVLLLSNFASVLQNWLDTFKNSTFIPRISSLCGSLSSYRTRWPLITASLILSMLFPIITVGSNFIAAYALNIDITFKALLKVLPIIILVSRIPISIGNGLGIREGMYIAYLGEFGLSSAESLSIALLTRILVLFVSFFGGFLYMLRGFDQVNETS